MNGKLVITKPAPSKLIAWRPGVAWAPIVNVAVIWLVDAETDVALTNRSFYAPGMRNSSPVKPLNPAPWIVIVNAEPPAVPCPGVMLVTVGPPA